MPDAPAILGAHYLSRPQSWAHQTEDRFMESRFEFRSTPSSLGSSRRPETWLGELVDRRFPPNAPSMLLKFTGGHSTMRPLSSLVAEQVNAL